MCRIRIVEERSRLGNFRALRDGGLRFEFELGSLDENTFLREGCEAFLGAIADDEEDANLMLSDELFESFGGAESMFLSGVFGDDAC